MPSRGSRPRRAACAASGGRARPRALPGPSSRLRLSAKRLLGSCELGVRLLQLPIRRSDLCLHSGQPRICGVLRGRLGRKLPEQALVCASHGRDVPAKRRDPVILLAAEEKERRRTSGEQRGKNSGNRQHDNQGAVASSVHASLSVHRHSLDVGTAQLDAGRGPWRCNTRPSLSSGLRAFLDH